MARVSCAVVCRPSFSGGLDVIAGCHYELPVSSDLIQLEPPSEYDDFHKYMHRLFCTVDLLEPPSEYESVRLVAQRAQKHFHNRGKVELDGYIIFYAVHTDEPCPLVYFCVAEPGLGFDDAQRFLDSIREILMSDAQLMMLVPTAGERDLQPHLDHPISSLLMAQNSTPNPQAQKMDSLREQVESVKSVMAQNVEAIMQRGERLENIEQRTEDLHASSANFKYTAHRVQRKMCLANAKWTVISVIAILIGLTVIILLILKWAGVFDKKN